MSGLSNTPTLEWIDLYSSDTTVQGALNLGQFAWGPQGKGFRYSSVNASNALVVGNVEQSFTADTNFNALAVAVVANVGDTRVALTNGGTAVTANQFDGGSLVVETNSASGTNLGDEYTIISHTAESTGSATIYFTLDRPIRTAWTVATTKITAKRSPFNSVMVAPITTLTGVVAGVAIYALPVSTYGWIQTKGMGAVLSDSSSIIMGSAVSSPSTIAAGAATLATAGFSVIGFAMKAADSTKDIPVRLTID